MYDIAIVGCGVVGAAAAFELSRYDVSVVVLERENDVATGTTKANSAIVHAGYDPKPGTLKAKLNVQGNTLVRELCGLLDVPYRQTGSLMLAFSDHEIAVLEEYAQRGKANGVPGIEIIDQARLRALEPNVSEEALAALYAPTAGIVCPWEFALALAECAVQNGVELRLSCAVTGIEKVQGGYRLQTRRETGTAVRLSAAPGLGTATGLDGAATPGTAVRLMDTRQMADAKESVEAKVIINAAGVHADTIHNMVAAPTFQIIPDRGVYYLLDKNEGGRVNHILFQSPTPRGKGTLVAPTVHGNVIVGPNNEQPLSPEDTAVTREGLAEVAAAAKRSVPSLSLRDSIRNFAGVRAKTHIDDFIIGEAPDAPGFIDLAAIKSPGLTSSPAIAKMAVELVEKSGLALAPKTRFLCARTRVRFAELSSEEKIALVMREPAYGRVICRCETVTEGEIVAALRTPVPPCSVDGVKRRVNAGMGRCQGGFCGPRVLELLARETGISPLDVPQDLTGSRIVFPRK